MKQTLDEGREKVVRIPFLQDKSHSQYSLWDKSHDNALLRRSVSCITSHISHRARISRRKQVHRSNLSFTVTRGIRHSEAKRHLHTRALSFWRKRQTSLLFDLIFIEDAAVLSVKTDVSNIWDTRRSGKSDDEEDQKETSRNNTWNNGRGSEWLLLLSRNIITEDVPSDSSFFLAFLACLEIWGSSLGTTRQRKKILGSSSLCLFDRSIGQNENLLLVQRMKESRERELRLRLQRIHSILISNGHIKGCCSSVFLSAVKRWKKEESSIRTTSQVNIHERTLWLEKRKTHYIREKRLKEDREWI